jgi:hypothetical protein
LFGLKEVKLVDCGNPLLVEFPSEVLRIQLESVVEQIISSQASERATLLDQMAETRMSADVGKLVQVVQHLDCQISEMKEELLCSSNHKSSASHSCQCDCKLWFQDCIDVLEAKVISSVESCQVAGNAADFLGLELKMEEASKSQRLNFLSLHQKLDCMNSQYRADQARIREDTGSSC